jgi:uncharacterized protein (DUF983 family)
MSINLQIGMQMREKKDASKRKCTLPYMRIASIFFDKQDAPEMGVNRDALCLVLGVAAVILELSNPLPLWVHLVLWTSIGGALGVVALRPAHVLLLTLHYLLRPHDDEA